MLGGGTDTILLTLYWNAAIMCNFPEVQKRASSEIDAFIKSNGRVPQFTERSHVPFCISVLKECMRFKPTTAFGIPHAVQKDGKYIGYKLCNFFLLSKRIFFFNSRSRWLHNS